MKKLFLLMLTLFTLCAVRAQVTTSGMNGTVKDQSGQPLVGATVIAVHTPSGTQYGAVTNKNGRYNMQGMRIGGPYRVTISFVGYQSVAFTDINLLLGENITRDAALKDSQELEAVVIQANVDRFDSNKTGAAQNFDSREIASVPTINRSIFDVTKFTPQSMAIKGSGTSFGGTNNRYNSFQIDGIVSNDIFGLTDSGTNGGQTGANPVSLDAIEEIQVVVAPFDVRQGGFTGGGINAITKSGTNHFKGSAYTYYNNEDFFGTTPGKDVKKRKKLTEQSSKVFGATIGGPIIKDKLFFFLAGEYSKNTYPSTYYPGYAGANITVDEARRIADRYKALTGYDGGGYGGKDIDTKSGSLNARIDWNISREHKLTVRYNFLDASKDKYSSSANKYNFNGASWVQVNRTHSLVAELNSRLSDNVSNELRMGWTQVRDRRDVDNYLPYVIIQGVGGGKSTATIGTEQYSGANALNQDIYTLSDNVTWYKGEHAVTFGTHNEIYKIYNLFLSNVTGTYTYNSLEDFEQNRANKYQYNYSDTSVTGGNPKWGPTFRAGQFAFYVQDEWKPGNDFSLTYGLRIDIPVIFDHPTVNEAFNASDRARKYDVRVGDTPKTRILWSPRIGFRWYLDEDHNTLVRGGAGIFTGRVPFVWLSNSFTNTGVEMKGITREVGKNGITEIPFTKDNIAEGGSSGNPELNVTDRNFKYPQVLRVNLAVEQMFGNGWKAMLEGLYTKTLNNLLYKNLVADDLGKKLYAVSGELANSSNTATYYTSDTKANSAIYYLTNTNKGYTYSFSASLQKHFDFGLDIMAAYTFGHAYSLNDGTSSQAKSSWGKNYTTNSNSPALTYSLFDIPHRFIARVSYTKRYARYFGSTLSLVYECHSGQRYTLGYTDKADTNGDGYYSNSPLYIPTDKELTAMTFTDIKNGMTADEQRAAFRKYILADDYMKNHRGQFTERNGSQAPFEHNLDLHFAQDFYFGARTGRKIQVTLDIINFGNMLCRSWGAYYSSPYNWILQPVTVTAITDDGKGNKTPSYQFTGAELSKDDIYSRWHMQLGVRVVF